MTDELTPEEREAFNKLPRERMPAGLETRVVETMRDHGFLARRRRAIELTSGRVAGLLAACVALMVGAYSIGLHRGDGSQGVLLPETMTRDVRVPAQEPAVDTREKKDEGLVGRSNLEAEQGALERAREAAPTVSDEPRGAASAEGRLTPESMRESVASPSPRAGRTDEAATDEVSQEAVRQESLAEAVKKLEESAAKDALTAEPVAGTQALRATAPPSVKKQPLTFLLNGSPVTVDADSVRVIQEKHGRVLLIYTLDGIIRIPLTD